MIKQPDEIIVNGIVVKLYREHADNFVRNVTTCTAKVGGVKVAYDLPNDFFNDMDALSKYLYKKIEYDVGRELFKRAVKNQ